MASWASTTTGRLSQAEVTNLLQERGCFDAADAYFDAVDPDTGVAPGYVEVTLDDLYHRFG